MSKKEKIRVEPLGTRIIVLRKDTVEETEGGIILPEAAQRDEDQGDVVSVGPDCKFLEVGDTIIIPKHTGTEIVVRGMKALALLEEEIMVRIHGL